jgi:hypothetical protein
MRLDLEALVLLGFLCSSIHWIVARSWITMPLWSRARGIFAKLLACASCTGFWLGLGLGAAGLRPVVSSWPIEILGAGLLGVFVTPVFEAVMLWGLAMTAIESENPNQPPSPP